MTDTPEEPWWTATPRHHDADPGEVAISCVDCERIQRGTFQERSTFYIFKKGTIPDECPKCEREAFTEWLFRNREAVRKLVDAKIVVNVSTSFP